MKLFPLLAFLTACAAAAARAAEPTDAVAVPPYRYLFVIDTSLAMSRQKEITIDTVHKLILSGINGRIHTGDMLGIWTFNEKLVPDAFPAQMWIPQQRQDIANRAYRFLRDQKPAKKARMEEVVAAIRQTAAVSGVLTAFLFSDGTSAMKGTPFDDAINEIFKNHSDGMRNAKKPFVVVFVAQEGQLVDHAVSPGSGPIYIPAVKKAVPVAQAPAKQEQETPVPEPQKPIPEAKPQPEIQAAKTNAPKTLSVEEIAAELARQSARQRSNATAVAPAPATPPPTLEYDSTPIIVAAQQKEQPVVQTPKAEDAGAPEAADKASIRKTESPTGAPNKTQSSQQSSPVSATPHVKPVGEPAVDPSTSTPPPQQTAVVVPKPSGSNPRTYLLIGVVLLFVAVVLGWSFFRNNRSTPQPSLISRSMDDEKNVDS